MRRVTNGRQRSLVKPIFRRKMSRFVWPIVSTITLGLGGVLGIRHEQKKHDSTNETSCKSRWMLFTQAASAKLQQSPTHSTPSSQNRSGEIMTYGLPGTDGVNMRNNYVVSYDRRMRNAKWVFECLTQDEVQYNDAINRTNCQFEVDQSVHPYFQSTNEDYFGSGYDRGHMAAAANHRRSEGAMQETFILSNVSPQVGEGFNRGIWNNLEKYVRSLTKHYAKVYVCTGPLYLPNKGPNNKWFVQYEVIGNNSVAVPTHFFKVVLGETAQHQYDLRAFIVPNRSLPEDTALTDYLVPVEAVERAAGLLLFERLSKNQLRSVNAPL